MPIPVAGKEREQVKPGDRLFTVQVTIRLDLWSRDQWTLLQRLQSGSFSFRHKHISYFTDFVGFEIERVRDNYDF